MIYLFLPQSKLKLNISSPPLLKCSHGSFFILLFFFNCCLRDVNSLPQPPPKYFHSRDELNQGVQPESDWGTSGTLVHFKNNTTEGPLQTNNFRHHIALSKMLTCSQSCVSIICQGNISYKGQSFEGCHGSWVVRSPCYLWLTNPLSPKSISALRATHWTPCCSCGQARRAFDVINVGKSFG